MTTPAKPPPRIFSLHWKALLVLGLSLAVTYTLVAVVSQFHYQAQFTSQREALRVDHARQLHGLTEGSARELIQLAETLPLLAPAAGAEQLGATLQRNWARLQLTWELEIARLYAADGTLLWQRGRGLSAPLSDWAARALEQEKPTVQFHCEPDCLQITSTPLLLSEDQAAVLVVGRNLAEFLLGYRSSIAADVGLLARVAKGNSQEGRMLTHWGLQVSALTNGPDVMPALVAAAANTDLSTALAEGTTVRINTLTYGVQLFPIQASAAPDIYVAVISDISNDIATIQKRIRDTVVTGILGASVATTLLTIMLWGQAARLQRITTSLPLLSSKAYGAAKALIRPQLKTRRWADEIDLLASATDELADKLEDLEDDVTRHSAELLDKQSALLRERDFVASILNHAQAVILTQDFQGRITLLNPFGRRLLGLTDADIGNRSFADTLADRDDQKAVARMLERLARGTLTTWQHEAIARRTNGSRLCISWFHSTLQHHPENQAAILSVGLDLTSRKEAEEKLAWLADHDELTGLYNRRRFQESVGQAIEQARASGQSGALLYLDLDHFKYINDTSGHHAGDQLLKDVADAISRCLTPHDVAARVGGDEFAVIIADTTQAEASQVADHIAQALRDIHVDDSDGVPRVSASTGIAMFPIHGSTVYDVMVNADLAMYQAKTNGRARRHVFSENERTRELMRDHLAWKTRIEQALTDDGFVFEYQPIQDVQRGTISHYEALLRMRGEGGGLTPPGLFIPVAEATGLIRDIDQYVVAKGIETLAACSRDGRDVTIAINLSGTMMTARELLVPLVRDQLELHGVNPTRIIFEVTETAAVLDLESARHMMTDIKALGCRFALDDFGVGLSSFSYLQQLPVDFIKIDGAFIRDLPKRRDNQLFVQALVQVAKGLERHTVAEFVEDAETLSLLHGLGVDYAQGYHVGRPGELPPTGASLPRPHRVR